MYMHYPRTVFCHHSKVLVAGRQTNVTKMMRLYTCMLLSCGQGGLMPPPPPPSCPLALPPKAFSTHQSRSVCSWSCNMLLVAPYLFIKGQVLLLQAVCGIYEVTGCILQQHLCSCLQASRSDSHMLVYVCRLLSVDRAYMSK